MAKKVAARVGAIAQELERASVHLAISVKSIVGLGRLIQDGWSAKQFVGTFIETLHFRTKAEEFLTAELDLHFAAAYLELCKAAQHIGPPKFWGWPPLALTAPSNHRAALFWVDSRLESVKWILTLGEESQSSDHERWQKLDRQWLSRQFETFSDLINNWSSSMEHFPDDAIPILGMELVQALLQSDRVSALKLDAKALTPPKRRFEHTAELEKLYVEKGIRDRETLLEKSGAPNMRCVDKFIERLEKELSKKPT